MKMRKFIPLLAALAWMTAPIPAQAWFPRGSAGVGKAELNLGGGDLTAQLPTNLFELAQETFAAGTNSPAAVDATGFPVANFSGTIGGQLGAIAGTLPTTGPYTLAWDAGRSCFKINFLATATITNIINATVVNGGGSGIPSVTGNCSQAGSVTINWTTTGTIGYQFDGTYTQWASNTSGKFYLARSANVGWSGQSDAQAYLSGIYWTQEAVNFIKALKPESIRPMGWNVQNGSGSTTNVLNWNYRKTTSNFSFVASDYPPGTRCGSAASGPQTFCTIAVSNGALTAALATDTPTSGWVDGEQLTGNVASTVSGLPVTGVASNGGNCQFTVSSTTGLTAGNPVLIETVGGATECNAHTTILSVDGATQFTVNVSKGTQTITSLSGNSVCMSSMPFSTNQQVVFSNVGSITGIVINTNYYAVSISGNCMGLSTSSGGGALTLGGTAGGAVIGPAYTSGGYVGYQTLTVTGKSGGPKIIVNNGAVPIGDAGDTLASGLATFTYNGVLDLVIYSQNGVANAVPLEAQVQLANLINANYWYNIPAYANNTFVTNSLNTIYSNLNGNLKLVLELDNELWNFAFKNTHWSTEMGGVLGITPQYSNGASSLPWQSLRNRQIFGNLVPASSWGSSLSRIDRAYGIQGAINGTSTAIHAIEGSSLVSPGNAAYQAYVGGSAVNYNAPGNRPGDFIQSFAIAPYQGGGTAFSGQAVDQGSPAPTSFDAALLNTVVSDWNASDFNDAESLIDQSIRGDVQNRVQTVSNSGTTFSTPLATNFSQFDVIRFTGTLGTGCTINPLSAYQVLSVSGSTFTAGQIVNGAASSAVNPGTCPGSGGSLSVGDLGTGSSGSFNLLTNFTLMSSLYTQWQNMAADGFSPALAGGAPKVRWYEGAIEVSAPTTAQCTAIGINSTDCATLTTAVLGWKNSSLALATMAYYYQTFAGTAAGTITSNAMLNASAPAQLVLQGGGLYGLNSNSSYVAPAPFQPYYGFQSYSAH